MGYQDGRGGGAGHMAIRAGAIGDVDGIGQTKEAGGSCDQRAGISGIGRGDLDGNDETSRIASLLEAEGFPRWPNVGVDDGRHRTCAIDHPQPRRAVPKAVIDRLKECLVRLLADPLAAVHRFNPDAAHGWIDLAHSIGAHPTAGSIAHLLGAIGRARHAGRGQGALAAHLAIEQQLLRRAFDRLQYPFRPLRAGPAQWTA